MERSPEVVYRTFLSALNDRDVEAAAGCVDRLRYREDCVGFTGGWVGWTDATASLERVWQGVPDLRVELAEVAVTATSDGAAVVLAHGEARGTADGRL